jgi:hypothetical protein
VSTTDLDDARVRALPRPGAQAGAAGGSVDADELDAVAPTGPATKVLVLANETVTALELLAELDKIDADRKAEYFVCTPANPVDTGQAEKSGAAFVRRTRRQGRRAQGAIGDYRPPHRVGRSRAAVRAGPDRILDAPAGIFRVAQPGHRGLGVVPSCVVDAGDGRQAAERGV